MIEERKNGLVMKDEGKVEKRQVVTKEENEYGGLKEQAPNLSVSYRDF